MTSTDDPRVRLHRLRLNRRSEWLVVELTDGDGRSGFGECSDACDRDTAAALLGDLVRAGVPDPGQAWRWALASGGDLPHRTVASGLAAAREDLLARRAHRSLARWLGGAATDVPVYANINRGTTDRTAAGFAATARAAVDAGYRSVKLAPFDGLHGPDRAERGLSCVQAVRAEVGTEVGLMVDVHEVLRPDEMLRIAPELRRLEPAWLEDVAPVGALDDLLAIGRAAGCPIAGGELIAGIGEVRQAVAAGALDVVLPDVKHAGGAARTLELVRALSDLGCSVSLHNPTGPVATATSAHVLGALGAGTLEVMFGEAGDRRASVVPEETLHGGRWQVPDLGDGIGLRLSGPDWETDRIGRPIEVRS